jgi:signal transduction histidine kinase
MVLYLLTAAVGPSLGLDPWLIGGFGLIPFAAAGWVVGRANLLWLVAGGAAVFASNTAGAALAGITPMSAFMNVAGIGLLLSTALLASKARTATDGQRRAIETMVATAEERRALLEIQSVIADTASALLQRRPGEAIDLAIAAIQRSTAAESVYLAMCDRDRTGIPSTIKSYDGSAFGYQPDNDRPWRHDPALQGPLEAGTRFTYDSGEGIEGVFPIISSDSKLLGLVGIIDSTGRVWSENQEAMLVTVAELVGAAWDSQQRQDRLHELLRSKDRFIASVSHELRTPLSVIVGLSAELRDDAGRFDPEDTASLIALVAQQSEELGDMIEDLLVSARAEEHQLTVFIEDVDLAQLVPRILESLPMEVTPKVTCCDTRPPLVRADPMRLRQVIRNLIVNAHRHGGPKIQLRVGIDGDRGLVSVTDNGTGIPEEYRETVFTAYGRASFDPGRPDSIGLGLTVSRQLARLMDGDIDYRLDSAGSTFEVSLPLATNQPVDVGLPMGTGTNGVGSCSITPPLTASKTGSVDADGTVA